MAATPPTTPAGGATPASTNPAPGSNGPSAAERLRAYHELEAWLKPYKEEIMGVYVNILVWNKPRHAAAFYIGYTCLLWYFVYSDRSTLNLVVSTAIFVAVAQLALTVARVELWIPAEVLKVDPSLYSHASFRWTTTSSHSNLLTFHDMCDRLISTRYWLQGWFYRINAFRRSSPITYFGTVFALCLVVYKSLAVLSDRTIVFAFGMVVVSLPALHHLDVRNRMMRILRRSRSSASASGPALGVRAPSAARPGRAQRSPPPASVLAAPPTGQGLH